MNYDLQQEPGIHAPIKAKGAVGQTDALSDEALDRPDLWEMNCPCCNTLTCGGARMDSAEGSD